MSDAAPLYCAISRKSSSMPRWMMSVMTTRASDWMCSRLSGTTIDAFGTRRIAIFSTQDIQPPTAFERVWYFGEQVKESQLRVKEQPTLSHVDAVLVFCDIMDDGQLQDAFAIAQNLARLGAEATHVILLHHSMAPKLRLPTTDLDERGDKEFTVFESALSNGIHDVIFEEPCGAELALCVHSRLAQRSRVVMSVEHNLREHRKHLAYCDYLEDCKWHTVWGYLRQRLGTKIPSIEDEVSPGLPASLKGFELGRKLGKGQFGEVFTLVRPDDTSGPATEVVKVMDKTSLTSCEALNATNRVIKTMAWLSLPEHCHPNIIRFYEVYHTDMNLVFRMENGGEADLNVRLREHERNGTALGIDVRSLIKQCIDGLHHMHAKMHTVHLDIKPENIIIGQHEDGIVAKYTDFDTSRIVQHGSKMKGSRGTFMFMAPEVILQGSYDPFAGDVWSLGIVFLEVVCRRNIMKQLLRLRPQAQNGTTRERMQASKIEMQKVVRVFGNVINLRKVLEVYCRADFRQKEIVNNTKMLLEGMLNVQVGGRWTTEQMLQASIGRFGPGLTGDGTLAQCRWAAQEIIGDGTLEA